MLAADRGTVRVDGALVPAPAALARIGYVPGAADPPEHLAVGAPPSLVAALNAAGRFELPSGH